MTEALENLVKNALDHTGEGDSVSIEWSRFNTLLKIEVKDNGCGIHPEDIHHIFKRFYRSRFSKDSQGLGLGLSLTKAKTYGSGETAVGGIKECKLLRRKRRVFSHCWRVRFRKEYAA